jgi:hypothetical protein
VVYSKCIPHIFTVFEQTALIAICIAVTMFFVQKAKGLLTGERTCDLATKPTN